jgi:molybdate transport system regulatory protein
MASPSPDAGPAICSIGYIVKGTGNGLTEAMGKIRHTGRLGLRIRVVLGHELALGPGRADLLAGIAETGSIAASGRRLSMSYKRAWRLVEEMKHGFAAPLVEAAKGGAHGGGARLTELGEIVLSAYRALEAACNEAAAPALKQLQAALPDGTESL